MSLFSLNDKILAGLTFGLARNTSQRRQALQLRHEVYARKGLVLETNGLYVPPQAFLPASALLVARREDTVIGTLSVYADSEIGLPIDKVHPVEVDRMRSRVSRVAEVGGLAVAEEDRSFGVTLMLYYAMFKWCRLHDFGGLIASTHPSAKRVYQSAFLFEILGPECPHPRWRSAPSIPLGLDIVTAPDRARKAYEGVQGKLNLYSFFCELDFPLDFPESTSENMQWGKDEIVMMASGGYVDMPDDVIAVLAHHYGNEFTGKDQRTVSEE